jgi:small-conductance mechanosensitive channel
LFFAGYFEVFGEKEVQIMAHNFFVKFLVTICVFITFIAFKRYFLKFVKIALRSSGKKLFETHQMGYEFVIILTKGLLYLSLLVTILIILNLWLTSQISWLNDFLKSTSILALSFVAGLFTSSILGNVLAYQIIIKRRDIKKGDRVKINEIYGDVESIDFFYTHIRNVDNEILSIPNLILLTKGIKNFTRMDSVVIHSPVTLGHGTDYQKAKKVILKAVENTDGVIISKDKKPHIWIKEFTGWTINCEVRAYTKDVKNKDQIKYQMTENILTALNKSGITTGRG